MGPNTMSDSGDSFEKIEFEQSALAAPPTSDQKSADLTTSDQQPAVLTTGDQYSSGKSPATSDQQSADLTTSDQQSSGKSPATTMSSSTTKTVQLEDLEFELAWKTRDEIIDDLNQHTALLSGLTINSDTRKKLKKANRDLVTALMDLPVKDGDRSESFQEPKCRAGLNEMVLFLSANVKARIIDTLVANNVVLLLGADSVSSERKAKLIDQNTDLAYELLKLKPRAVPRDLSKGT